MDAKIHNVFHVSQLKLFVGESPSSINCPDWITMTTGAAVMRPYAILDTRMIKVHNAPQIQYLVQWEGHPEHEATWEVAADFVDRFPEFPEFSRVHQT